MTGTTFKALAALTGAAVLAGCAASQSPTISTTTRTSYDPKTLNYAAGKGGMPVDIHGEAFAAGTPGVDTGVTEGLQSSLNKVKMPFFTERPAGHTSPYRVVMLFNPAQGAALQNLCESDLPSAGPNGGRVDVTAAYCASDKMITRVSGRVGGIDSPQSAGFQALMTEMGQGLFLNGNPDQDAAGAFDG